LTGALNDLAWALATHERGKPSDVLEAVQLAEQACKQTAHQNADMLDTLAAAYANANRFADAIRTARKAAELALSSGQTRLVERIRSRLRLYQAGRPYRR